MHIVGDETDHDFNSFFNCTMIVPFELRREWLISIYTMYICRNRPPCNLQALKSFKQQLLTPMFSFQHVVFNVWLDSTLYILTTAIVKSSPGAVFKYRCRIYGGIIGCTQHAEDKHNLHKEGTASVVHY